MSSESRSLETGCGAAGPLRRQGAQGASALAQYFASRLINLEWLQPGIGAHRLHRIAVRFEDPVRHRAGGFTGRVTAVVFGRAEYQWHPEIEGGYANPDGPPATTAISAAPGTLFRLPPASITVLRGAATLRP